MTDIPMTGPRKSASGLLTGQRPDDRYFRGSHNKTPYPVQWTAGVLSCIFPFRKERVPHRIVLTSFHGDGYRGNTRILFEQLCMHPDLRPVWLSRNPSLVDRLREQFGDERACLTHSLHGIRTLRSAGAVFLTHGTSDYAFMRLPGHALVIQTYHGLPTKRGEYLRPKSDRPPGFLHRKVLEYRFHPITHFLSSAPLVSELFSSRFNIPRNKFLETGYPAYDRLMRAPQTAPLISTEDNGQLSRDGSMTPGKALAELWPDAPHAEKLILYAPTFRRRKSTRWFPFPDRDLQRVARWLEEHNALMALRAHPNEAFDTDAYRRTSRRFVSADQSVAEDATQLLPLTNAMISDYSSITLEGLLLDIPAVFLPYDLESYERGLPLPYSQMAPGPSHHTQTGLLDALSRALTGSDGFKEERRRVRNLFFSKTDGQATRRVIRFLEEQLL